MVDRTPGDHGILNSTYEVIQYLTITSFFNLYGRSFIKLYLVASLVILITFLII